LIGGAIGASGGAINGAANYMEEHGTLDGSGGAILEGAAEGFAKGTKTGAEIGYSVNSMRYMKNPNGFCFVAGTLVLTAIGLTCIEDIRPGDYVYAKNEVTGEQDYMPVLETYENEVTELCTVTIDGNSIETTPGHKFYTTDNGWVSACDLNKGDTVELSDGSNAEVDNVETTELDEPITVYNFNVMDYHTYYVGESEVLVHNTKCTDLKVDNGDVLSTKGRSGKQKRLREIANDDKASSALRGEIKRDINEIQRGKRKSIRVPSGYQMAHRRGYEARKGFGYEFSDLNTIENHRRQHKIDGYGRKN